MEKPKRTVCVMGRPEDGNHLGLIPSVLAPWANRT